MSAPPTDDEREALADLIEGAGIYVPGSHGHDYINPGKAADAILAAGFRRQGPITDAQVEAAARSLAGLSARLWEQEKADDTRALDYYRDQARAALEAARDA